MPIQKLLRTILISLTLLITGLFVYKYNYRTTVFYGDALGYYLYLPSTFIYHNLKTPDQLPQNKEIPIGIYTYVNQMKELKIPTGNTVDQYTYGVALMELPFFAIAHAWEKMNNLAANGYSENYFRLIKLSSMFYALMGLILVYKILKKYFSQNTSLLTTIALFIATNLFWFSVHQAGMSHIPIFFLYALLIYLTIYMHNEKKLWQFIVAGFCSGLITIIRPSDVLCLLIPLLYNVYNEETIIEKIIFLKANFSKVLVFFLVFILPFIPQLIYWKAVTGKFLFYSYGEQGFHWRHPKIIDGLFYFSNGWLPYSPIMIFALIGIFFTKSIKIWKCSILAILPVYIYIIYSWWCYRYINGLGSRPMIHLYPLLAVPLAAFIQYISKTNLLVKTAAMALFLFFISINLCLSIQQIEGVIWSEESNGPFTLQMLYRTQLKYDDLVVNDIEEFQPDSTKLVKIATLGYQNYDDSLSNHFVLDTAIGRKFVYHTLDLEITNIFEFPYQKSAFKDAKWIKCSGDFMYPQSPGYEKHKLVLDIDKRLWMGCKIENKILGHAMDTSKIKFNLDYSQPNHWGYISFYTRIPKTIKEGDIIKLFLWSTGRRDLYMKNLKLEIFR